MGIASCVNALVHFDWRHRYAVLRCIFYFLINVLEATTQSTTKFQVHTSVVVAVKLTRA